MSRLSHLDHTAKGLAFPPTTNGAYFAPYGAGCASGIHVPLLDGVGAPAPGSAVTMHVANGPGGAPGGLAIGLGGGTFSLTPTCIVQILPLANVVLPIALAGSGAGTGTATVPLQIPLGVRGDLYFQTALFDGSGLVLSNPTQMHVQ